MPIVNRLEAEFGDQIDFVLLDIDDPGTLPTREQYGIVGRTQYVLVDADGDAVQRWFGPLNQNGVFLALEEFLTSQ